MKRTLSSVAIALVLIAVMVTPALAATSGTVTVTFTPGTVAYSCNATSFNFGAMNDGTTAGTPTGWAKMTNTSTVPTEVTIGTTNATWTGGNAFTHSNSATPGTDTVGVKASKGTGAFDIIVKTDASTKIATGQAPVTDFNFEIKLYAPTSHSDAVQKGNGIVWTASPS